MSGPQEPGAAAGLSSRGPEVALAAFLLLLGAVVVGDSLRVGASWADDGPQAGYFPFFIGLGLCLASGAIIVQQLWRWKGDRRLFVTRAAARDVFAVLWPMGLFVALIPWAGLYLAAVLLVLWFMRRHGAFGWALSLAVPVGFMLLVYLTFERWFLVPLPKGALGAWLGL